MKKKKKRLIKNKKLMKRVKIIILVVLLTVIGVIGFLIYRNHQYMNSVSKNGCGEGRYYYNIIIASGCKDCPKGQYCPDGLHNKSCPKGLTTRGTRSVWSKDCNRCTDETKYYSNGKCLTCKQGYYCKGGTLNECPSGKTTKSTGKKNYNDCVCKAGTYASGSSCKACPKCNGSVKCFTSAIGSTSVNNCSGTVPAGKYINCSASGCTVKTCEGNTYSKSKKVNFKSNLSTSCTKCSGDKVANSSHSDCVCKTGTYASGNGCKACPKCNGNVTCFTSAKGSTKATQCTGIVPAGKYITCNSSGCTVKACEGNTYSTRKSVSYSSSLKTTCTSCGNKKANSNHTGCV